MSPEINYVANASYFLAGSGWSTGKYAVLGEFSDQLENIVQISNEHEAIYDDIEFKYSLRRHKSVYYISFYFGFDNFEYPHLQTVVSVGEEAKREAATYVNHLLSENGDVISLAQFTSHGMRNENLNVAMVATVPSEMLTSLLISGETLAASHASGFSQQLIGAILRDNRIPSWTADGITEVEKEAKDYFAGT